MLLFYCNNGCTNAPQCYVIRTLPVLLLNKISIGSTRRLLLSFPLSVRKTAWLSRHSCYDTAGTTKKSWFHSRPRKRTFLRNVQPHLGTTRSLIHLILRTNSCALRGQSFDLQSGLLKSGRTHALRIDLFSLVVCN